MSEEQVQSEQGEAATADETSSPQTTAGALLRQAREAAGLHVAALAVSMKVPVKKLEALEADHFELLPDAVFVRALAASVCRTLKIDPTPVLALLPQTSAPQLKPDEWGINAPFRAPGDMKTVSVWDQLSRPGVLAALALLAGALVLIFFPAMERQEEGASTASEVVSIPAPAPVAVPSAPSEPQDKAVDKPELVVPAPVPAPAQAALPASSPSVPASPASGVTAAAAPVVTSPASSVGVLAFKARATSWVEVTDAQGVVQLRRTLITGESVAVSGALPLSVVVGRADATEVTVRGKPFGLDGVAKENVARFEVK